MKIGIFGGTFDPVHEGHLRPIDAVADSIGLDRVEYVVNRRSPWKAAGEAADSRHRVAMLALALAGRPRSVLSFCELDRPEPSYTVDTLREFSRAFPGDDRFFLLGSDAWASFPRWRDPEEILRLARLAVFVREPFEPGPILEDPFWKGRENSILIFGSVRVTISSTDLRAAISRGESISGLTPGPVEEYIFKQRLYSNTSGVGPR
ncbi:MAG: nicotinate (nicotinamide) nucleotide adenylyltransferase [Thermoanaerobaculia bacterium]